MRGLADAAGVSAPTATRTLDPLERAGIVRRRRSAPDRRVVTVSLTPSGRNLLAGQRAWIAERQHALYASLAPGERASAAPLLNRLAVLVDELSAGPGRGANPRAVLPSTGYGRAGQDGAALHEPLTRVASLSKAAIQPASACPRPAGG